MVADGDSRAEAEASHWLAAELLRAGAAAAPVTTEAPSGAKSGVALTVGEWVIKGVLSAATLNAVTQIVVAFVQRSADRSIVLERDGDRLEITGVNAHDQQQLIQDWLTKRSE